MPKPPPPATPVLPDEPALGTHLDLVCLQYARKNIRGRIPPDGPTVVVRTGDRRVRPVPAEIFTVEVERSWVFGHTRYVKGSVTESRLEVPRLALRPLGLRDDGPWDPEEDAWLFELEPTPLSDEIRAAGPRTRYEMEQVVPEDAVRLEWEDDPILEAVALAEAGAVGEAEAVLSGLLTADLRCLDAHAHLGHLAFRSKREPHARCARRHYQAGVAIGELSLPAPVLDFQGLLPRGLIDNRPFLRCLHGLGLTHWRDGDFQTAEQIFRRLVWLDPHDGIGARILVEQVRAGLAWEETYG